MCAVLLRLIVQLLLCNAWVLDKGLDYSLRAIIACYGCNLGGVCGHSLRVLCLFASAPPRHMRSEDQERRPAEDSLHRHGEYCVPRLRNYHFTLSRLSFVLTRLLVLLDLLDLFLCTQQ